MVIMETEKEQLFLLNLPKGGKTLNRVSQVTLYQALLTSQDYLGEYVTNPKYPFQIFKPNI